MWSLFILVAHLLVTLARLARPGGVRAVAAESLAIKRQLLIMKRARQRRPNLTSWDRVILGFCTLLVSPRRPVMQGLIGGAEWIRTGSRQLSMMVFITAGCRPAVPESEPRVRIHFAPPRSCV